MPGVSIKSKNEIEKMRAAGKLAAQVLDFIEPYVKPGISTLELNDLCDAYTIKNGAVSAPLNYKGFPKSICSSINNVVCHGIPKAKDILKDQDIVNLDITVILDGYHGDTSKTFMVGENHPQEIIDLVNRTHQAMMLGIEAAKPSGFIGDIGAAIEDFIAPFGYGIVRDLTGHGIGIQFHEEPQIIHYKTGYRGAKIKPGMTFTVEPMINLGGDWRVVFDPHDHWTVRTRDGQFSAQFEHTILITEDGNEILTLSD